MEPKSTITRKSAPLSTIAAYGMPRAEVCARRRGKRPSRAMARVARELATSTAFPLGAVARRAVHAINHLPGSGKTGAAARASGAGGVVRNDAGRAGRMERQADK